MGFLHLYLTICSEIDVVAKVIAKDNDQSFKSGTIREWGPALECVLPGVQNEKVVFNNDYDVKPWKNWYHETSVDKNNKITWKLTANSRNPEWWNMYNKVKHQGTYSSSKRLSNFETSFGKMDLSGVLQPGMGFYMIVIAGIGMIVAGVIMKMNNNSGE